MITEQEIATANKLAREAMSSGKEMNVGTLTLQDRQEEPCWGFEDPYIDIIFDACKIYYNGVIYDMDAQTKALAQKYNRKLQRKQNRAQRRKSSKVVFKALGGFGVVITIGAMAGGLFGCCTGCIGHAINSEDPETDTVVIRLNEDIFNAPNDSTLQLALNKMKQYELQQKYNVR